MYLDDAKRASMTTQQASGRQRIIGPRWVVIIEDNEYPVYVEDKDGGYEIECKNRLFTIHSNWDLGSNIFQGTINDENITFRIRYNTEGYRLTHGGNRANVTIRSPRAAQLGRYMPKASEAKKSDKLIAPMAGRIVRVAAKKGETIKAGAELLVIEAMKMENLIKATYDVKIEDVKVKDGDSVAANQELIKFAVEKEPQK